MAGIVRLETRKDQINDLGRRRRLSDLIYAPAALCSLPEGLPVTIRRAGPGDAPAIRHLAEIDEAPVPAGQLIVAEVDGELWAAASLERNQGISDPFRPSGALLRALDERAGRRACDPGRRERLPLRIVLDGGPRHDDRSHPPLVRASTNPAAERDVRVRGEERDARFGERVDGGDTPDAQDDPDEVVETDHRGANTAGETRPPWQAWLALLTVYVVWGSTYLAIRVMVQTVPALLGAGARFVIAGLVLYAWVWVRRGRAALRVSRREAAGAACVGILLTSGGNGLVTVAERHVASSLAALVIASVPFAIVLIRVGIGERVGRRALIGVGVGFAGVAILILPGTGAGGSGLVGALLVLAAAIAWGAGSVSSTRLALPRDLGASAALQMTTGGVAMLIAGLAAGEAGEVDVSGFSTRSVTAFAYLVVFGSIVAFSAYTWLLRHVPISRVATYAYVNPVIAVLLGWMILGETISPTMLVGASVIVGSVAFTIRATRTEAGPERKGAQDRPVVATARRRV